MRLGREGARSAPWEDRELRQLGLLVLCTCFAGQIQAESKRGKHVRKRRRFFMKTQPQKPDADTGRCKDEALQRAPRQIQEQFQHRMVPPVFNRKCRTGRAEGLLPEGQDVRSCRAQFHKRY